MICSVLLRAQQIQEVKSEVKDQKVLVHYVIKGGSLADHFSITLYESNDGGSTYTGPLKEVKGDAGTGIRLGKRTIIWDALKEMPYLGDSVMFQVKALKQPVKEKFFITLEGNSITWLGLRAGTLGKIGFYAEARGNPDAFKAGSFNYSGGVISDYSLPGYYTFTGKNGYSAFSLIGGLNWQFIPNLFLNGGAGYGKQNYLVQIDKFSYSGDGSFTKAYAKYKGYCFSGLEFDAGLMYRLKWFLLSAGVTTINLQIFNWTAGAGVTF
jgi:hypothetical protein